MKQKVYSGCGELEFRNLVERMNFKGWKCVTFETDRVRGVFHYTAIFEEKSKGGY